MGYIICKNCGGHYQLQQGESPDDFESCQCGGQLEYVEALDDNANSNEHTCPNCGLPISEYSIICRNCGFRIGQEDRDKSEIIQDNSPKESDNGGFSEEELVKDIPNNENEVTVLERGEGISNPNLEEITTKDANNNDINDNSISKGFVEENIICPQCKKENDQLSNFCKFCGYDLQNKKPPAVSATDKSNETPVPSNTKTCPSCGAEIMEYSIICRNCGKTLKTELNEDFSKSRKNSNRPLEENSEVESVVLESISDDLVYILTSIDFIKTILLLGFAVVFAGKILGVFFSGIVFLFCAMVFSILSKKNIRVSLEGGVLLATFGIIILLIFHSSWSLSIIDLTMFFFFSIFGAFLGWQLVKRGFVK